MKNPLRWDGQVKKKRNNLIDLYHANAEYGIAMIESLIDNINNLR